jgi:hypothetical protein
MSYSSKFTPEWVHATQSIANKAKFSSITYNAGKYVSKSQNSVSDSLFSKPLVIVLQSCENFLSQAARAVQCYHIFQLS